MKIKIGKKWLAWLTMFALVGVTLTVCAADEDSRVNALRCAKKISLYDYELVEQAADGRYKILRSPQMDPAVLALLDGARWGSPAMTYARADFEYSVDPLGNAQHFLLKARVGEEYLPTTTCSLSPRRLKVGRTTYTAQHLDFLATAEGRLDRGYAKSLVDKATDWAKNHYGVDTPVYAYLPLDHPNLPRMLDSIAWHLQSLIQTHVIFRRGDAAPLSPLTDDEVEPMAQRLAEKGRNYSFWMADNWVPQNYLVLREGGEIVAGVEVGWREWREVRFSRSTDWLVGAFGHREFNPRQFSYLRLGNFWTAPGHADDLPRLVQSALARAGVGAGVVAMDQLDPDLSTLRAEAQLGWTARQLSRQYELWMSSTSMEVVESLGQKPILVGVGDL